MEAIAAAEHKKTKIPFLMKPERTCRMNFNVVIHFQCDSYGFNFDFYGPHILQRGILILCLRLKNRGPKSGNRTIREIQRKRDLALSHAQNPYNHNNTFFDE